MKLKPVVVSLALLGVVSSPAVLAHTNNVRTHHTHRGVDATRPLLHDAAGSEALVAYNNAKSPVSSFDWTKRIHVGGLVNVDARYASRGPLGIVPVFKMSDDAHGFSVNNANLFVDADVNRCVGAHIGLAYVDDSVNNFDIGFNTLRGFDQITKQVRSDKSSVWAHGIATVDEAYITIADFAVSPVFVRAGKMYTPFGSYTNPYPISYSLSQVISQTRATGFELGAVTSYGVYGSVMAIQGHLSSLNSSDETFIVTDEHDNEDDDHDGGRYDDHIPYTRINNYVAKLGYQNTFHCFDVHVNGAYIKDFRDVNYLADIQDLFRFTFGKTSKKPDGRSGFHMRSSSGASVHADVTYGPFMVVGNYVTAFENMVRDVENGNDGRAVTSTRLWAGDVTGTYTTELFGFNTVFGLSYQHTGQGAGILPEWRYQGNVDVEIFRNTTLSLEYRHDRDYDERDDTFCEAINEFSEIDNGENTADVCFGTGRTSNQATLRLSVVF